MKLGHVALMVGNLDLMVDFYAEVVGLQVSDIGTAAGRVDAPRIAFLSWDPCATHHQIALLEIGRDPTQPRNVNHIAFEVASLDDLRVVWSRVSIDPRSRALATTDGGPVTAFMGDQWSIRFADPEGNGIEIYAPTPWDAAAASAPYSTSGRAFEPFDLDATDEELRCWGERHMNAMGQPYWPRGQRPLPDGPVRSRNS